MKKRLIICVAFGSFIFSGTADASFPLKDDSNDIVQHNPQPTALMQESKVTSSHELELTIPEVEDELSTSTLNEQILAAQIASSSSSLPTIHLPTPQRLEQSTAAIIMTSIANQTEHLETIEDSFGNQYMLDRSTGIARDQFGRSYIFQEETGSQEIPQTIIVGGIEYTIDFVRGIATDPEGRIHNLQTLEKAERKEKFNSCCGAFGGLIDKVISLITGKKSSVAQDITSHLGEFILIAQDVKSESLSVSRNATPQPSQRLNFSTSPRPITPSPFRTVSRMSRSSTPTPSLQPIISQTISKSRTPGF